MLNLKKTAVAVLAFGSSAAFAGTMGPVCAPGNVTVPCASTAWDFGVQALYLQPTYSGLGYVGSTTTASGTTTNEAYIKTDPNWAWGFKLEGSYHFNTGNDLNLNWYYLDHTTNKTLTPASGATTSIGGFGLPTTGTQTVRPSDNVTWDAVNIEFGQHAHFGEFKNIRFHGGAQYGYIKNDFNGSVTDVTTGGVSSTLTHSQDLSFSGFGPRIGADYWYNWGNGFSMYAKGATALLVGTQKFTENAVVPAGAFVTSTGIAAGTYGATGSTTAIVPELEGKLGAKYTYAMAQGDLSLDLGWMWVNYFNALEAPGIHPAGATGTAGAGNTTGTNFAVQGPFVGLKWIGNVA
jgi:hypothetical protein